MTHHLKSAPHDRPRWNRVSCARCGAKAVVHDWDMKQDKGKSAFDRFICLPPPDVTVAEEEVGSTCLEDSKRTT